MADPRITVEAFADAQQAGHALALAEAKAMLAAAGVGSSHLTRDCAEVLASVLAREATLRAAVQEVLDDEESGPGGWGPDVTTVFTLKAAMEATAP